MDFLIWFYKSHLNDISVFQGISKDNSYIDLMIVVPRETSPSSHREKMDLYLHYNQFIKSFRSVIPIDLSATTAINYNLNTFEGLNNAGIGPMLTISKQCFKRAVQLGSSFSMLQYKNGKDIINETMSGRISCAYTFKKKHRFLLQATHIAKNDKIRDVKFHENRISIEYSFYFQSK